MAKAAKWNREYWFEIDSVKPNRQTSGDDDDGDDDDDVDDDDDDDDHDDDHDDEHDEGVLI